MADQALFLGRMFFGQGPGLGIVAGYAAFLLITPVPVLFDGLVKDPVIIVSRNSLGLLPGSTDNKDGKEDDNRPGCQQVSFGYLHQITRP